MVELRDRDGLPTAFNLLPYFFELFASVDLVVWNKNHKKIISIVIIIWYIGIFRRELTVLLIFADEFAVVVDLLEDTELSPCTFDVIAVRVVITVGAGL